MAEGRKIEGLIADENGQPVRGATVHVKGTQNSAASDRERALQHHRAARGASGDILCRATIRKIFW